MNMSQKNPTSRKFLRRLILIFAGLFLVSIILFIVSNIWIRDNQHNESVSVFAAKRGPLTISVTESGTINNREKVVVKSEVR
jgi:preprotein translocase subunit SecG